MTRIPIHFAFAMITIIVAGCAGGGTAEQLCGDGLCVAGEETSCPADCYCGDGVVAADEQCDGTDLREQTCGSQGELPGVLACNSDCTFDTTNCNLVACGNGVVDSGESCDGDALGEGTCANIGFGTGTLSCTPECRYDVSACCNNFCPGAGATSCDGDDLLTCVETPFGCRVWEVTNCATNGDVCEDDGTAAQCMCINRCPGDALEICNNEQHTLCEMQPSGCLGWTLIQDCGAGGDQCTAGILGPVCVSSASGEDCADPYPLVDGSNVIAWSATVQDYLTAQPSCMTSGSLTGPDVVLAYTATVDGFVDFAMAKPTNTRYVVVVSSAACGTVDELLCVQDYSPAFFGGAFPVSSGTTYYFYVSDTTSGSQPLVNPINLAIESTACTGIVTTASNQFPAVGATTNTLTPSFSVDFDNIVDTLKGVVTITGNMGTSLSYDLSFAPVVVTFSNGDKTMTIEPGVAMPAGEQLVVSWTGLFDFLCQAPIAAPAWQLEVVEPSCAPGLAGVVGTTESRMPTGISSLSEYYLEVDDAANGYIYLGGTTKLYRIPKTGGTAQDVTVLASLTSTHLGYAMLIVGDEIFTVDSKTSGTTGHLWRISTNGGATWQLEDYATFPTQPGDDFRGIVEHAGRIYMVTHEYSASIATEIWSVNAGATILPATPVLEASFTGVAYCNSLAMDTAYYYLGCGTSDKLVRVHRTTNALHVISDSFDLSTTTNSVHTHDINNDGLADALYFHGWKEDVFYVCEPAATPYADNFANFGAGSSNYGMAFDRSTNTIWAYDDDTQELVSFH